MVKTSDCGSKGPRVKMPRIKQITMEKEYEKNPDISPEDIDKLRQWLKTQPHLPGDALTDLDLMITFHCCERSQTVSRQVLDLHYTLKTLFTSFFKERSFDSRVQFCLDKILFAPLAWPTLEGYRVVYLRVLDPDPRCFIFNDCVRTFMMMFDLWQYEEGTWPGFVMMIDMDQTVIGHITRLEVMSIRQVLYFLQNCMLIKLKSVHFLNAPSFMDKLMMMLRPFLNKTLMDLINIHQVGSDTLEKFVPRRILPKEDGGEYKTRKEIQSELIERLKENQEFWSEERHKRVNEKKRPGKAATIEDLFGIQGSFKKLDID
ncbi:alpha-tocopherol transfer protein-like isoform X2 [Plodia interpunctella]|uniref:alpha-tocopherol transfer protein-like isoform X2 n=1 Tax=Plodia interpunctella TaxID=58824 RepID=UPI002368083D|nr:alpha-tocopherol transfer protein-like isoform X2 [Plodia interpunctella]